MRAVVHVNQHKIKQNLKRGTADPVITVKTYRDNHYADGVDILCPCCEAITARVVYSPTEPLPCGARVWIAVPDADQLKLKRRK